MLDFLIPLPPKVLPPPKLLLPPYIQLNLLWNLIDPKPALAPRRGDARELGPVGVIPVVDNLGLEA